jgi:hypothetical protein
MPITPTSPNEDITVDGTVVRGNRAASKNIKFQLPHLIGQFPDIKNIYSASINVRLDSSLLIRKYDHNTSISWWDVDEGREGFWHPERFSLLEIKFEFPIGATIHRAWFYESHDSGRVGNPVIFEIVSQKIEGLSYGSRCKIHVDKSKAQLLLP